MPQPSTRKRRRRPRTPPEEEIEDCGTSGPEIAMTTTSESQDKRKRGERGRNKYPKGQWSVEGITPSGEPVDPPLVRTKFRNAIGALIRTEYAVDPTILDWFQVPEGLKGEMWAKLKQTFLLPQSKTTRENIRHYARKALGESFRRWKGELNRDFVKKGATYDEVKKKYGMVTEAQWNEFVRQKTTPEALALSQRQSELSQRNVHRPRLGPGGYLGKQEKWRRTRDALIAAGQPDPFEGLDECGYQWLLAREPEIIDGKLHFAKEATNVMCEKITNLSEAQRKGDFVANRDRDVLSTALGTREHGGRIRGVSSKLSIRDGFERDRATYRSHCRFKEDLQAAAEKVFMDKFQTYFNAVVHMQQASGTPFAPL